MEAKKLAVPYDYYRIFYYVAQHKSFTKAAEALGNNQPNITRCMNNLEQDLGCKLFVRTNHGVSLTPEGKQLYSRAAVAFEQLRLGESEIRADCSLRTGSISIAASETALHLTLLNRLDAFHRRYPGVHLRITNDSTPPCHGRTAAGEGGLRGGHHALSSAEAVAGNHAGLLPGNSGLRFGFSVLNRRNTEPAGPGKYPFRLYEQRDQHIYFLSAVVLKAQTAFPCRDGSRHHGSGPRHGAE